MDRINNAAIFFLEKPTNEWRLWGGLTKSISGLVLKAWKSSLFIDTNILASIPREVPIPYKINRVAGQRFITVCKLGRLTSKPG